MERTTPFWIFLITASVVQVYGQYVDMDDELSALMGSKVDLRCRFVNSDPPVKISQVTWQKLVNGSKQNVAIANPSLGVSVAPPYRDRVIFKSGAVRRRTPVLEDTTITISSLRLSDEAMYICEYTTFPAGNRENTVNLTVNTRPTTQMSLSTPTQVARSSNMKTPVATCTCSNGKPACTIRWDTRVEGEAMTQEYSNPDGTFTVQSDYILVPSRETHQEVLTCVSIYNDEEFSSDSVTLDIQYEPEVSVDGFDGNWYLNRDNVQLSCEADANPAVSLYQWRVVNGSIPSSVEIKDNVLIFKGPVTTDLEGTYVCDATNSIGTQSASVAINVIEKPLPLVATADLIGLIALLLAAGTLLGITITVVILKIRINMKKEKSKDSSSSSHKKPSQPPRKKPADDIQYSGKFYEELPNTADYVSYRLACNKEDYPEPFSPPINPPLSFLPQHPYNSSHGSTGPTSPPNNSSTLPRSKNTFYPHTSSMQGLSSLPPGIVVPYTFPKEQYV